MPSATRERERRPTQTYSQILRRYMQGPPRFSQTKLALAIDPQRPPRDLINELVNGKGARSNHAGDPPERDARYLAIVRILKMAAVDGEAFLESARADQERRASRPPPRPTTAPKPEKAWLAVRRSMAAQHVSPARQLFQLARGLATHDYAGAVALIERAGQGPSSRPDAAFTTTLLDLADALIAAGGGPTADLLYSFVSHLDRSPSDMTRTVRRIQARLLGLSDSPRAVAALAGEVHFDRLEVEEQESALELLAAELHGPDGDAELGLQLRDSGARLSGVREDDGVLRTVRGEEPEEPIEDIDAYSDNLR